MINFIRKNKKAPLPTEPVTTDVVSAAADYHLIAVITAAIAASIGTSPDKLIVRSLRRVSQNDKQAWRIAAKSDGEYKINQWR